MVEQFQNNYVTLLNGAIDDNDTTIVVDDAPDMTGSFRIRIEDEIIYVGTATGTTFTGCLRGQEDTVAISHGDNTIVRHVLTMGALNTAVGTGNSVYLDPFVKSQHDQGWSTFVNFTGGSHLFYLQSSGSQNAEITWPSVLLEDGTYSITIVVFKSTSHGIIHVQKDGTDIATFDLYNGSNLPDQQMTVTGVSISGDGNYAISLQMATKNGSSSNYYGLVNRLIFTRTA